MAGLGHKTWAAGDILAAADVNGYLMDQSVMVFDNASARTAALSVPSEGMMSYTKDDNSVQVYNGTAWAAVDTTISSINASNVVNTLSTSTATAYTFATADQGKILRFTSSSAITASISTATAMTAGQRIDVLRDGTGSLTITAGTGVSLAGAGAAGTAYTVVQYEAASILCVASNTYRIIGNVTAVQHELENMVNR